MCLHELLNEHDLVLHQVIITDRDLVCINALAHAFPSVPALLCRWHANHNVLTKTLQVLGQIAVANPAPRQDKYENTWEADSFMHTYYEALAACSEADFEAARTVLAKKCPVVAAYLDLQWWRFKDRLVHAWA